ncbi:MAG: D-alanyl-D-alanine carboxypeptidase/D-alanyl-D-alanine-endopeptidase [Flavobacteriales bacterium]|nr:D-alanyl-D-alanine carboxypeptidase/D-alanyl-D-alanine-endopeptidase [Flavobacteriales bacterium]
MKIESYFYKMKNVLLVFVSLLFINGFGQNSKYLNEQVESKELKTGILAFHAQKVSNGEVVATINAEKWMSPASILKLATTTSAIEILGPDHRFETKIGYTGHIEAGVLKGDLIVKGGGDPSLGFDITHGKTKFPDKFFKDLISVIKDLGINSIDGNIIADNSHFSQQAVPSSWAWGDIGNYYGAASYGLNFFGNRYSVYFRSGKVEGSSAEIGEIYPRIVFDIDNQVKTANIQNDQAYIYAGPGSKKVYMEGRIPMGKSAFEVKGAIPDPSMFFIETLELQLNAAGIDHNGDLLVEFQRTNFNVELFSHYSASLKEICIYTNRFSDNFFAETLLKQIGAARGEGSTNNGIRVIQRYLSERGINPGNFNITDGSGLSRNNLITAKGMVELLMKNLNGPNTKFTELGLSVSGRTGSLKRLGAMTCLEGKVQAKSGYMRNVRSYAGVFQNAQSENIVFCIIMNDFNCTAERAREIISEVMSKTMCQ